MLLQLVVPPAPTVADWDEHQLKGTPVMGLPRVSSTVAVTVFPLPEVTLMELLSLPVTAAFGGDAFYSSASATATAQLQFMTGRAFGLSGSTNLLSIAPVEA